jgi:hypothetical protein
VDYGLVWFGDLLYLGSEPEENQAWPGTEKLKTICFKVFFLSKCRYQKLTVKRIIPKI